MAIYKASDLFNQISQIINDGYTYVDITELEADDEDPASLSFDVIEDAFCSIDYESVSATELPENYNSETSRPVFGMDDFCGDISFTYKEIFVIKQSLDNALEYLKDCSNDPSCSKEVLADIKSSSVLMRNLQAKLAKRFKNYSVS